MTVPREAVQAQAQGAGEGEGRSGASIAVPVPRAEAQLQQQHLAAGEGLLKSGLDRDGAPPTAPGGLHKPAMIGASSNGSAASVLLGSSPDTGLIAVSSSASLQSGAGAAPSSSGAGGPPAGGRSEAGGSSSTGTADSLGNKTLYLGNLHPFVTEQTLQELFAGLGGITELKVIKDKATGVSAGYGFAKFADYASATVALEKVNKATVFGQEVRINWAFQKEAKDEAGSGAAVHVFVGDLSSDVTDAMLHAAFQGCPGICDARVMWDHATGRSRGYGFVSFRQREEAEAAIQIMHGQFIGARRVRCGWAQHKTDNVLLDKADPTNTNVYVGNLAPELSDAEVRRHFAAFGAIAEVKLYRKGSYGFVRFKSHEDAVRAIVGMNGQVLVGKVVKCSWGRHPGMPPTGVQTSLMLAAAAGLNPLAMGAGGMLGPAGSMGGPVPLGHMMAGGHHGAGMMGSLAMPMAGGGSQAMLHGGPPGGPHLHHPSGPGAAAMMAGAAGLDGVGALAGGAAHHGGGPGGAGAGAQMLDHLSVAGSASMGMLGSHYGMAAGLPHPYGAVSAAGMFGFGPGQ
eukprot:scaffold14.g1281.t1